jgi:hypothetical protein
MSGQNSLRILPGAWRPHYPWEHIAWINPPWGSNDYVWLDFPEAIFTDQGLLYLSHINPKFPVRFPDLPHIEWDKSNIGISYQRILPNGISFQGSISTAGKQLVELLLIISNGSIERLTAIRLQTCMFMRAYYQLSAYNLKNKYIHTATQGWIDLQAAKSIQDENGSYHLGWRGGPKIADLPVIVCKTSSGNQVVAFSWLQDTYSLISNPDHPCIHADPAVPDLKPGECYALKGEIYFANNGLEEIEKRYGK